MNKQIEEMARTLCGEMERSCEKCNSGLLCEFWLEAQTLYNAGYRKQSEGEWIKDAPHWRYHCNQCGFFPLMLHGDFLPYCPNCGAKMKGGEE